MAKTITIIKKRGEPDKVEVKQQSRLVPVTNKKPARQPYYRIPKLKGR